MRHTTRFDTNPLSRNVIVPYGCMSNSDKFHIMQAMNRFPIPKGNPEDALLIKWKLYYVFKTSMTSETVIGIGCIVNA
jgi:hypothetical protein